MNYIDFNSSKVILARQVHFDNLFIRLLERIEKFALEPYDRIFAQYINDNLELLLTGTPSEILRFHESVSWLFEIEPLRIIVQKVFNYSPWFISKNQSDYCAYDLAKNLDINTCTYCNRMYTKTVIKSKDKITRPEFDHWFPKKSFPILALSFYNLIPSCGICNTSVKGINEMTLDLHLHPYINEGINLRFSYENIEYDKYEFKVLDNGNEKVRNSIEFFKIKEIYETHLDEIEDLVKIKQKYSINYLDNLQNILKGASISEDEIYRLAFSTYKVEENFNKRPLSRMKRDILMELGIIS